MFEIGAGSAAPPAGQRSRLSGAGSFGSFATAPAPIGTSSSGGSRVGRNSGGSSLCRSSSSRLTLGTAIRVRIRRPGQRSTSSDLGAPACPRRSASASCRVGRVAETGNKRRCAAQKNAFGRRKVSVFVERLKVDGAGGQPGAASRCAATGERAELQNKINEAKCRRV